MLKWLVTKAPGESLQNYHQNQNLKTENSTTKPTNENIYEVTPRLPPKDDTDDINNNPGKEAGFYRMLQQLPSSEVLHLTKNASKLRGAYVTDDPLATLRRHRSKGTPEEIYAVSRLNPLFRDEESSFIAEVDEQAEHAQKIPESPTADHNSVRSSGYGSKENDSNSDISDRSVENEDIYSENLVYNKDNRRRKRTGTTVNSESNGEFLDASKLKISKTEDHYSVIENLNIQNKSPSGTEAYYSQSEPVLYEKNSKYVDSVRLGLKRSRSLETVQEVSEDGESPVKDRNKNISVPSPVWPNVSNLTKTLQRQADRIYSRRNNHRVNIERTASLDLQKPVIRFNPLVSVVTQNSRYVTAINVSPKKPPIAPKTHNNPNERITYFHNSRKHNNEEVTTSDLTEEEERLARYFNSGQQSQTNNSSLVTEDYPIMSLQPDSLVTEDTLRMMNYPEYNSDEKNSTPIAPKEDDHAELEQVMYSRGLYATLNRNSLLQNGDMVKPPFKSRKDSSACKMLLERKSSSCSVKKKGLDTVRDLWEKTGLKTNGRKLLVDVDDLTTDNLNTYSNRMIGGYGDNFSSIIREPRDKRIASNALINRGDNCDYQNSHLNPNVHRSSIYHVGSTSTEHENSRSLSSMSFSDSDNFRKLSPPVQTGHILSDSDISLSMDKHGIDNLAYEDDSTHQKSAPLNLRNHKNDEEYQLKEIIIDTGPSPSGRIKNNLGNSNERTDDTPHIERGIWMSETSNNIHKMNNLPADERKYGSAETGAYTAASSEVNTASHGPSDQPAEGTPFAPVGNNGKKPELVPSAYTLMMLNRQAMKHKNATFSRKFSPHPNRGALNCQDDGTLCADFTLDGAKAQMLKEKYAANSRQKKCCLYVVVVLAFVVFLGIIVALSWYLTGGKRIFGPM